MNRVQFIVIYIIGVSISMLKADIPTFADIPWLTPAAEVKLLMAKKGYIYVEPSLDDRKSREDAFSMGSDLDLDFSGKIMGIDCGVHFVFNESNRLVQASVNFKDKNNENKHVSSLGYFLDRDVHEHLERKYGKPTRVEETGDSEGVVTVKNRHWESFQEGYSIYSSTEVIRSIQDGKVSKYGKLTELRIVYVTPMVMDEYNRRKSKINKVGGLDDL